MIKSSNPLVSVVIPTYNRADLVTDAIDSVLNQTYENFELLVVDDHSTDNTEEVIKGYNDPRIKYLVNRRSKGAQGARNTGLYKTEGEWIAFLDSDDQWVKEKLEVQLKQMYKNELEFSFTNRIVERTDEQIVYKINPTDLYKENYVGTFSSVMITKTLQQKVGLLDESLRSCQDWNYWIRASEYEIPYLIEKALIVSNNKNHKRITNTNEATQQGHREILEKYFAEIKQRGYLSDHYYKLALISGEWGYLREAVSEKFNLKYFLRCIYYNLVR